MKLVSGKNILIVTSEFPPQPGGIGKHALDLATALQQEGFEVVVICDERSENGLLESEFDRTLGFKVKRIRYRYLRLFMYIMRIVSLLTVIKKCDHVIATGKFSLWAVAFAHLFYKKSSLAVIHGTEVNLKHQLVRRWVHVALKQFEQVVAVSQYTAALVSHLRLPITVIPNGIHLNDWQAPEVSLAPLTGYPALITVGRVSPRKGQLRVINHLPALLQEFPEAHYHCVGLADRNTDCLEAATRLGVLDRVHFHGAVTQERLKELLYGSHIMVMLSAEAADGDVEGFGIALLEANALGIPAIGSLGCGIEDAVNVSTSGELIPAEDTNAFVISVKIILTKQVHYAHGAKQWAVTHDWKILVNDYIKLLA